MRKPLSSILGCCLAALPLIGCVEPFSARQAQTSAPTAAGLASPIERVYAAGAGAPAAILVFVPATAIGGGDVLTGDPALWTAQGFDVVMPRAQMMTRLIVDRQAALERLLVSARALADAPIWLVGPAPEIKAAMPQLTPGQASGVLVTSVTSSAGSCSRTVFYSNPSGGAEPRVTVRTSGDACGTSPPIDTRPAPSGVLPAPRAQPAAPRIIETSIPDHTSPGAQQRLIRQVAEEIKGLPSS